MKKLMKASLHRQGFTLIELLVVIAIIATLGAVVFAALNPAQRLADARDARRYSDVNEYLTAIHECIVDAGGGTSSCLGSLTAGNVYEITGTGTTDACNVVCTNATDASSCAVLDSNLAAYLASLPTDPGGVTTGHTEYTVSLDSNGLVTITSCSSEGGTISAAR